jgi:hypothetical protein
MRAMQRHPSARASISEQSLGAMRWIAAALSLSPARDRSRRTQSFGWWLAVLAFAALNLQSLQHYQPSMLLAGDVCSIRTDDATSSAPQGKHDRGHADCGMCCAQALASALPYGDPAPLALPDSTQRVAALAIATPATATVWTNSRPRGPPIRS